MISLLVRKVMNMLGGITTAMKKFHFLMIWPLLLIGLGNQSLTLKMLGSNPTEVTTADLQKPRANKYWAGTCCTLDRSDNKKMQRPVNLRLSNSGKGQFQTRQYNSLIPPLHIRYWFGSTNEKMNSQFGHTGCQKVFRSNSLKSVC